uniref:Uncharacterized protein n=1 Tax=Arundo donax TaxID=35708 RepID=A0A0A8Z8V2_ARUDO
MNNSLHKSVNYSYPNIPIPKTHKFHTQAPKWNDPIFPVFARKLASVIYFLIQQSESLTNTTTIERANHVKTTRLIAK